MSVGRLARGRVHRLGAQRAGTVFGVPSASGALARVGGFSAVISCRPVTVVDPTGVITRVAYTPNTCASSAGSSCAAWPHARPSRARQEGMHSCTHCRRPPWAGR